MKYTLHDFIVSSQSIHGDKYDYSKSIYISSKIKIEIICRQHGSFWSLPTNHISRKSGCPTCSGYNTNKHSFIKKARKVHGEKYDYSLTDYKSPFEKISIVCPEHGEFVQFPNNHLNNKQGCSACSGNKKSNVTEFIEKSKLIHNNKYDYTLVEYSNNSTAVNILCHVHGKFTQQPDSHLQGHGCPACSGLKRVSISDFIERSKLVHGDTFDYSNVTTIKNTYTKIPIICKIHGQFYQTPELHWLCDVCCPGCNRVSFSRKSIEWLTQMENTYNITIQHALKPGGEFRIPGTRLHVDGYCIQTNTIYEFHGDIWHGNPTKFEPNELCHPYSKLTAGELFAKTTQREELLRSLGYTLITIWENDYDIIRRKNIQNSKNTHTDC
jgi:hypothetical protein